MSWSKKVHPWILKEWQRQYRKFDILSPWTHSAVWRRLIPSIKMFRKFFRLQPLRTLKMCHILFFFTPQHIFTKCGFGAYLQIDAVAQNVLQILSAPFSHRCTFKMCQIPYSLAYLLLLTTLCKEIFCKKFLRITQFRLTEPTILDFSTKLTLEIIDML